MADKFWLKVKSAVKKWVNPTQTDEAEVTASGRVIADHPSFKITPAKLKGLLEDAEAGDITAQHELFADIEERDGDIAANMGTRKRAILTLDWGIFAPEKATPQEEKLTESVQALFERMGYLDDFLMDCMDAVGHGFSAMEIEWQLVDGQQLPLRFLARPQSWFRLDKDDNLLLKTPANTMGEPLRPFGWVVHVHKNRSVQLARNGLYRTLAWLYMFKHYAVHDFAEFLELYGMPIRIGKYGAGATEGEKKTLLRALAQIGHNAAGIMPESMAVELHNAASGTSSGNNPFLQMIDWCEKSIARLILGQTLTSGADGKSSTNALGTVHNEVRRDLLLSDARQIEQTITQQVILPYLQVNVDPNMDVSRLPYFAFDTQETEDLATFAEALPKLVDVGMQIPEHWAKDKLGIPEPKEDEPVLKRVLTGVQMGNETALKNTALSAFSHGAGCPCGCQAVALGATIDPTSPQGRLDGAIDEALGSVDFNAQLDPLVQVAVSALMRCESYAEASDKLAEIYPDLTSAEHQRYLRNGLLVADLLGGGRG
ncbi:DUF935 domain-containing protein [Lonepinella sp. BR2271]|uniref:DUF935 domain-containing protein n=1 Tax=Lonepinella sp. BR2271 TaxID=3434550 RepID=UPI003F6DCB24